jgi:hypothetical protein
VDKPSANSFLGGAFMYYVGIDVSKYKHDCFIVTSDGEIIRDAFSFGNNHNGFHPSFNCILYSLPFYAESDGS